MKQQSRFQTVCDRLALVALCLFAGECVLGGSGRWFAVGSVSIRILLFALCFALTLPNVLRQIRTLFASPHVILCVLLGFYLAIAAVIGWKRGNNSGFIRADITSYLTLALLPGFLATIKTRKRVAIIIDAVFYCALILGIVTVGLHFYLAKASDTTVNLLNNWINDHHMGGFANLGTGVLRIYIRSHIFLQVAILIGLHKLWCNSGIKRILGLLAVAVITFACILTYTRGFWLGLAVSAVILLILAPSHWKRYFTTVGMVASMLVGLFAASWLAYGKPLAAQELVARFDPDLIAGTITPGNPPVIQPPETDPTDPDANKEAVVLRQKSLLMLHQRIREHPILGNGLGTNLDGIREDGKTEYMYHDTVMKLGLVGFAIFCCVFFLPLLMLIYRRLRSIKTGPLVWGSADMDNCILLAAYMGVAITSYVNPFLLTPMGILLVFLLSAAVSTTKKSLH